MSVLRIDDVKKSSLHDDQFFSVGTTNRGGESDLTTGSKGHWITKKGPVPLPVPVCITSNRKCLTAYYVVRQIVDYVLVKRDRNL